ncbi:hypothetical protein CFOL_v3_11862, partial [Cephalotus follicularis]
MSSILSSQGVVLATAMAVSGTVLLLAFRLQKVLPVTQFALDQIPQASQQVLRSCISYDGKRRKKNKKVHFAEDVVDPRGDGEEFRRKHGGGCDIASNSSCTSTKFKKKMSYGVVVKDRISMPANRVALYNGILRDRVMQRLAYSC